MIRKHQWEWFQRTCQTVDTKNRLNEQHVCNFTVTLLSAKNRHSIFRMWQFTFRNKNPFLKPFRQMCTCMPNHTNIAESVRIKDLIRITFASNRWQAFFLCVLQRLFKSLLYLQWIMNKCALSRGEESLKQKQNWTAEQKLWAIRTSEQELWALFVTSDISLLNNADVSSWSTKWYCQKSECICCVSQYQKFDGLWRKAYLFS